MTDGMLFRETMLDPLLQKYSVIMVQPLACLYRVRYACLADPLPPMPDR